VQTTAVLEILYQAQWNHASFLVKGDKISLQQTD